MDCEANRLDSKETVAKAGTGHRSVQLLTYKEEDSVYRVAFVHQLLEVTGGRE